MPIVAPQVLTALAAAHLGEAYVLGVRAPYDDLAYAGPWDCAELATWVVRQATGHLLGVNAGGEAYSGAWATAWVAKFNYRPAHGPRPKPVAVPAEVAAGTPGAVLVRAPSSPGLSGHVALVVGVDGATVEAYDTERGVIAANARRRRWSTGVLVPDVDYRLGLLELATPSVVLRDGDRGPGVRRLQAALRARGYDPGPVDGIFGPRTAAAVVALQRAAHVVADGEVGPVTDRLLGGVVL